MSWSILKLFRRARGTVQMSLVLLKGFSLEEAISVYISIWCIYVSCVVNVTTNPSVLLFVLFSFSTFIFLRLLFFSQVSKGFYLYFVFLVESVLSFQCVNLGWFQKKKKRRRKPSSFDLVWYQLLNPVLLKGHLFQIVEWYLKVRCSHFRNLD